MVTTIHFTVGTQSESKEEVQIDVASDTEGQISWTTNKMTCQEGEFNIKLEGKVPCYLLDIFHGEPRDVLTVSCIDGSKLCLPKLALVALSPLMRGELGHRDEEYHVVTTERESSDILQVCTIHHRIVSSLCQLFDSYKSKLEKGQGPLHRWIIYN